MASVVPDDAIREDVINDLEWTLTRALLGLAAPLGLTKLPGVQSQLIVTQKTAISPALRVVFSVEDEPPIRRVNFHAAGLRDQNGDGL
jgi:hypothetical protein